MRCMIPFWIHLLAGIHHIRVLFVWLQFDKKNAVLNILNPGQRREGTSSTGFFFHRFKKTEPPKKLSLPEGIEENFEEKLRFQSFLHP